MHSLCLETGGEILPTFCNISKEDDGGKRWRVVVSIKMGASNLKAAVIVDCCLIPAVPSEPLLSSRSSDAPAM